MLEVDREPLDFRAIEKLARKHADQRDFAVYRLAGKKRFIDVLASG